MSYWFGWISRLWGVVLAALATALLLPTAAQAADFRDPSAQQFLVWPNIPVVKAADLDEYAADRKLYADMHGARGGPATILAALQAVDALQLHHASRAGNELGRSLNAQVLGEIDRLTRNINTRTPKLRFEFARITPAELQRIRADMGQLLDAHADRLQLIAIAEKLQLAADTFRAVNSKNHASQALALRDKALVMAALLEPIAQEKAA